MKKYDRNRRKAGLLKDGTQIARELGVSGTFVCAVRHAMGLHGKSRFMDLEAVRVWLRDHPEFKIRDFYPRPKQEKKSQAAQLETTTS
jgi:hypothetical protein